MSTENNFTRTKKKKKEKKERERKEKKTILHLALNLQYSISLSPPFSSNTCAKQKQYLSQDNLFKLTSVDSRVENPDQRLCDDIEKWCTSLAALFTGFTKPFVDGNCK